MDKIDGELSELWDELQRSVLALAWQVELKGLLDIEDILRTMHGIFRALSLWPLALLRLTVEDEAKLTLLNVNGKANTIKCSVTHECWKVLKELADSEEITILSDTILGELIPSAKERAMEVWAVSFSQLQPLQRGQKFVLWEGEPKPCVDRWTSLPSLRFLLPKIIVALSKLFVPISNSLLLLDELAIVCRWLGRFLQPLLFSHADSSFVAFTKGDAECAEGSAVRVNGGGTVDVNPKGENPLATATALRCVISLSERQGWLACFSRWLLSPRDENLTELFVDAEGSVLSMRLSRQRRERKSLLFTTPNIQPPVSLSALQGFEHVTVAFAAYRATPQKSETMRAASHQIEPLFSDTGVGACAYLLTLFEEKPAAPTFFSKKRNAEVDVTSPNSNRKVLPALVSQCTIEKDLPARVSSPRAHNSPSVNTLQAHRSHLALPPSTSQLRFEDYLQERLFEAADTPLVRQSVMQTYVTEFVPEEVFMESSSTVSFGDSTGALPCEQHLTTDFQRYIRAADEGQQRFAAMAADWNCNSLALGEAEQIAFCLHLLRPHLAPLKATDGEILTVVTRLCALYRAENPYHNFTHAVSVLHATHYLLGSNYLADLNLLERAGMLLAALGHDVGHKGCSNHFEIHARSELAVVYNDISPLENYHASLLFRLLNEPEVGFIAGLGSDYWKLRSFIVEAVLATDMKLHFKLLEQQDALEGRTPDKKLRSCLALHAADVSASSKSVDVALAWSRLVNAEFYQQYIREGELGIKQTPNFRNLNIRSEQLLGEITFVKVILLPFYRAVHEVDQQGVIEAEDAEASPLARTSLEEAIRNCEANVALYPAMQAEAVAAETGSQ